LKTLALILVSFVLSAQAAPPGVVKATPENGSKEVDPNTRELRVVFDQPMQAGSLSVVGGGPTFPKFVGTHRWEDERTFVWSWRLEPTHDYWLSINSDRFRNFRSAAGESAEPHPIGFRTGQGTSKRDSRADHFEAALILRGAILEDYSYHDLHGVNWRERFAEHTNRLAEAGSAAEFARIGAELLAPAKDIHLWFEVDGKIVPTFQRTAPWNINLRSLPSRVERWSRRNAIVSEGEFQDGIGYVLIRSFPSSGEDLKQAFEVLERAAKRGAPLIIDVRANGGGSENAARQLAGCFVEQPVAYAKHVMGGGKGLTTPHTRELEPNKAYPTFTNRVVVLAGLGTVSSAEAFVMMMQQNPRCTIIGERTAGASGNPTRMDLGNGVVAFVPSWKDMNLKGELLETRGIEPQISVSAPQQDFVNADPILAAALKHLRDSKNP
jgi:RNA polymerase sigma-70 factor (ECF subfamily)